MTHQVSVIVPCYNEKENILPLAEAIHEALSGFSHEIVIVDDNSPDGTYAKVVQSQLPHIKAILRTENRGLANSIRCGLEYASGEIVVVMDSDFNHQPKYIPFMVENLRYYDFVSASRFLYGGSMDSRARHVLSWVFNLFTRIMTGGSVTDSLYGFWAARRAVLEKLEYDNIFWGYGDYCIRLMFYLQKLHLSILQFPAVNGRRLAGMGNGRFVKVFIQYSREVVRLTWKERVMSRE